MAAERGPEGPHSTGRPTVLPWPGNGQLLLGPRERSCFRHAVPSGEGSAHPSRSPARHPQHSGTEECSAPPARAQPPHPTPAPRGDRARGTWGPQHLPEPGWALPSPCHVPLRRLCLPSQCQIPPSGCSPCRGVSSSPEEQHPSETPPPLPRAEGRLAALIPPQRGQGKPPSRCAAGQDSGSDCPPRAAALAGAMAVTPRSDGRAGDTPVPRRCWGFQPLISDRVVPCRPQPPRGAGQGVCAG